MGRSDSQLEELAAVNRFRSRRGRVLVVTMGYVGALLVVVTAMIIGYRSQSQLRLQERTRELEVAYESVTSTIAATPELFYAQIADDPEVTGRMQAANRADDQELRRLNQELLAYLQDEYAILEELDFRQLHFHLADNRSFVRFHRPDRFGDDLTEVRATVRAVNATQTPAYGFEEGKIYNGFRYVYPMFHEGEHVGSVEASISYRAIISRMRSSHPLAYDFILSTEVIERSLFEDELDNYQTGCFSSQFARETGSHPPNTHAILGVSFACIVEEGSNSQELVAHLESYQTASIPLTVEGVPIAVSLLPLQTYEGPHVAYILGYSRFDEISTLRAFFGVLGAILGLLTTLAYGLFLRITIQRERVLAVSKDLQQTIAAKDRFFSIVSHDLRGPIGSLASLAGMLQEELQAAGTIPDSTIELAEVIAEGAENSSQLLIDLLDWSRSQRGDIPFHPTTHRCNDIVEEQLSVLRRTATEKEITLSNHTGETTVFADEYMLKVIIRNLVSNGIKFTPEGGAVTVAAEETPQGTLLSVTDTGVGMSEEQQTAIFDWSVKSSTKGTRAEAGTGLGLTVCREFVHRHGGTLSVDSQVGIGSTFRVYCPNQ